MALIIRSANTAQFDGGNTQAFEDTVVFSNDGSINVEEIEIAGYPVEDAFGFQRTATANTAGYNVTNFRFNGLFNGYQFGGRNVYTPPAPAPAVVSNLINKLPFANEVNVVAVPGVLNADVEFGAVGKSSTKAYVIGGRTTPPSPVAHALHKRVFPFAIGDTAGTYLAPTPITTPGAPLGFLYNQASSDVVGGKVFVASGGGIPGAACPKVIYFPTAADTDAAVDYGDLNTARRVYTAFSDEVNSKGVFASGIQQTSDPITPGPINNLEVFPFATGSPLVTQFSISPGLAASPIGQYYGFTFQSTTTGYFGRGANGPATPPQVNSSWRNMYIYKMPFSSYTTISIQESLAQNTVINQCGMSGFFNGYAWGGWPGNPASTTAPAIPSASIKYVYSSDTVNYIQAAPTPSGITAEGKWFTSGQGTQD